MGLGDSAQSYKGGQIWAAVNYLKQQVGKLLDVSSIINPNNFSGNLEGQDITNPQELANAVDSLVVSGGSSSSSGFYMISDTNQSLSYERVFSAGNQLWGIDGLLVSGAPVIQIGTTLGGRDLMPPTLITNPSFTFRIIKTFVIAEPIYITISGGVLDINYRFYSYGETVSLLQNIQFQAQSSSFTINLPAGSQLWEINAIPTIGIPKISVGTTLGGVDVMQMTTLTKVLEYFRIQNFISSQTLYFTVLNGTISTNIKYYNPSPTVSISLQNIQYNDQSVSFAKNFNAGDLLWEFDAILVSGNPIVSIGTTVGGSDVMRATAINSISGLSYFAPLLFATSQVLYITISGGVATLNFKQFLSQNIVYLGIQNLKFASTSSSFSFYMPANSELWNINGLSLSGTPVIKVGLSVGGSELLNSITGSFTQLCLKDFPTSTLIYVTITGGVITMNFKYYANNF